MAEKSQDQGRKKPELEQVIKRTDDDAQFWGERNKRMEDHQDLFDLVEEDSPVGEILVYLNDTRVLIKKLAGLVARRKYRIEVPARDPAGHEEAQTIENACYWWADLTDRDWMEGLHPPLAHAQALSLFLRGWIAARMTLAPDTEAFVDLQMFDPYNVYPKMGNKSVKRVTHAFSSTVEDLIEDFPECETRFRDDDPDRTVLCHAYYENQPPFWHCVIAEDDWVKKPQPLDYFPWVIRVPEGALGHAPLGNATMERHARYIGTGFLDMVEGVYKLLNKFMTILANTAVKQENPPIWVATKTGKVVKVDTGTGGRTFVATGDTLKTIDIGPSMAQLIPLVSTFQDRMNKGGLPSAMYGEGGSLESGYMGIVMINAAQDVVQSYMATLKWFYASVYKKFLEIFRDFGEGALPVASRAGKGDNAGRFQWSEDLTPEIIDKNGTLVLIQYEDFTPQDRMAMAQLAIALVTSKLLSMRTARSDYLSVDNPELENDRVIAELVYQNQMLNDALTRVELAKLGQREELQALMAKPNPLEPPPQIPLGMGTPPAAPAMPTKAPGLPAEVMPPEAAGMLQQVPGLAELLARIQGGG